MAISLKRYDRQVGVSEQTGTQAIGGGLASSMIQEAGMQDQLIGDAIGALGDAAVDFFEHKAKGEVAKYKSYKQDWANNLEVKKQEALLNGGLKADELYDKVVIPEQLAFENWVTDQGFSTLARQQIDPDVTNFGKKINASERLGLIQLQIEQSNYDRTQEAEGYENLAYQAKKEMKLLDPSTDEYKEAESIYNLNTQKANETFNDLKRTTKLGVIDEMRSTNRYKRYNLEASLLTEDLAFNRITPQQFQEEIISLRKELEEDSVIDESRQSTLLNVFSGKVKSAQVTLAKQIQKIESDIVQKTNSVDGWTSEDGEQLRIKYGDTLGGKINRLIVESFAEQAISDENVKILNDKVQNLPDSPDDYEQFVREAAEIGGKYAELARQVAAIYISEMTNEDATISYRKINPQFAQANPFAPEIPEVRTTPYNGWVKGFHKQIIEFTDTMPLGTPQEVNKFVSTNEGLTRQLIDYYYSNPNPSDDELAELSRKMFGSFGKEIATKTTVLETPKTQSESNKKDTLGIL